MHTVQSGVVETQALMTETIDYKPPPTLRDFITHYRPGQLFYNWIVGPVGSGKTTGIFFKLIHMAQLQEPSKDGIRRTRAVIVRNTMPQLRDTTLSSWNYWFKDGQAGSWRETEKKFTLKYNDVECEVLFRPLDTADDIARVLSLEVTFAILDEFVQIPREIVEALSARCGRYQPDKRTPVTNWGMWGSSNPSTEDNWWYEYLHKERAEDDPVRYFRQPSGFADNAENVENLPGKRDYYVNQARDKSEAWVKQFLEAEWGFSIAGKPVVPTFRADTHVARRRLNYDPLLDLVIGFDPGIGTSALVFGQQDLNGQLRVLAELVQSGYGAERLVRERLKPFLMSRFPEANVTIAPDPQAGARNATDENTIVKVLKKYYPVSIESNNRLPLRLDAIEHFTTRLTQVGPALIIDPTSCPVLVRGLKGGWRYIVDAKREVEKPEPDKNLYSHPCDAFGYLCRHYHRGAEREAQFGPAGFKPPRQHTGAYHVR
jgi:hypothetical protein